MADVSQIKLPNGSVYDLIDEKSGYITAEYIENKTDYEIPVSRVGEIVVGETAIGTDSTNFPTSKAVVDYVDERVVQEMDAIDVGVTGIKANGRSLTVENGVVNIPVISPNQSVGLITTNILEDVVNSVVISIPTSTSQLNNDSGFITASDIPTPDLSAYMQKGVDYVTAGQKSGTTLGSHSTAEGNSNTVTGQYAHAEGDNNTASNTDTHAEGHGNTVSGSRAHAEGEFNTVSGSRAHVEGSRNTASGYLAHVEGQYNIAASSLQHVFGEYNIQDGSNGASKGTFIEIVGNGHYDTTNKVDVRSNARTLDWSGNEILAGKLTVGAGPTANMDVATKQYVDNSIPTVPTNISSFTNDSGYLTASDIASVMTYKGTKANYAALPSTGNTTGDVWHITNTGAEWAWDGSAWQELGTAIDLSGYATKATTLAGYGITDAKIQNGTITLGSNTITPLTSYTETDPTVPSWAKQSSKPSYTASEVGAMSTSHAANGITTAKINAWDAKSDFSGSYNDLTDKPTIPTIPTNVSAFTNDSGYLTSYTETDPTVPSWAKASSKPSYGLTEISGTDDLRAIEALTGTSGLLKKTAANTWTLDTNTYLTSYTETDPVFSASAAAGITSTDISNWNSKTSNTGTVTSIAVSNATNGGLTVSGSPITTNGTVTIGHSNVLTSAQTTQAVYPIKIDKNGHISAYGSAVTIPTVPTNVSSFTNDSGYLTLATLPIYDGTVE